MILVICGRSTIGSPLIDILSRQEEEVRALVRPSEGRIVGQFARSFPFRDEDVRYR
jgi:nucleoside-diphosphate-sugar epimerase